MSIPYLKIHANKSTQKSTQCLQSVAKQIYANLHAEPNAKIQRRSSDPPGGLQGASWKPPRSLLGASCDPLGASCDPLGASWEALESLLGASREPPGSLWGAT